jgi:hypothetical protein
MYTIYSCNDMYVQSRPNDEEKKRKEKKRKEKKRKEKSMTPNAVGVLMS